MNKIKFLIYIALLVSGVEGRGQIYINSYRFGVAATDDLLLDSFPNASAAYSFRKLDKDYGDSCVIVRRRSDNTTQRIGFISNYLDTASMKTFCGTGATDSCWVQTWYDQSGSNRNATQNTNVNQGRIMTSGAIEYHNGEVCLITDGISDFYSFTSFTPSSSIFSIFAVQKRDASANSMVSFAGVGGTPYVLLGLLSDNLFYLQRNNGYIVSTSNDTGSNEILMSGFSQSASQIIYKNNTTVTTSFISATIGTNFGEILKYSTAHYTKGKTKELIIYASDQDANRTTISNNINRFYSIY